MFQFCYIWWNRRALLFKNLPESIFIYTFCKQIKFYCLTKMLIFSYGRNCITPRKIKWKKNWNLRELYAKIIFGYPVNVSDRVSGFGFTFCCHLCFIFLSAYLFFLPFTSPGATQVQPWTVCNLQGWEQHFLLMWQTVLYSCLFSMKFPSVIEGTNKHEKLACPVLNQLLCDSAEEM